MKFKHLLAATALVAAIGTNAQGVKYMIANNPEISLDEIQKDKDGYYILFDGTSMKGLGGYCKDYIPSKWNIKDGALHFNGRGEGEGGDIIFTHQFKNFIYEVEWKISEGGNSGIFYLAQEVQNDKGGYEPIYVSAPECQVLDNENHPDARLGKDGNRMSSSLYDMIPAKPQNSKPHGEWNKIKILCYKGIVVHYQNDEPVVEYHLWTPQWTEMLQASKFSQEKWPVAFELLNNCGGENHEGYIGFQDHGDDVWFRNIKVKVLE